MHSPEDREQFGWSVERHYVTTVLDQVTFQIVSDRA